MGLEIPLSSERAYKDERGTSHGVRTTAHAVARTTGYTMRVRDPCDRGDPGWGIGANRTGARYIKAAVGATPTAARGASARGGEHGGVTGGGE